MITQSILQKQPKSFSKQRNWIFFKQPSQPLDLNPVEQLQKTKLKTKRTTTKQQLKVTASYSISREKTAFVNQWLLDLRQSCSPKRIFIQALRMIQFKMMLDFPFTFEHYKNRISTKSRDKQSYKLVGSQSPFLPHTQKKEEASIHNSRKILSNLSIHDWM